MTTLPTHEGYLTKQGGVVKNWKRRWFSLQGKKLRYFEKQGKKELGLIDLEKASEISLAPECKKPFAFKIVIPKSRTYFICAENQNQCDSWVSDLKNATGGPSAPKKEEPKKTEEFHKYCLDDFEFISVIGRGTYGKVQLVKCKQDGKMYAMKTMSKKLIEETDQVEQTINERNLLMSLRHPFLISASYSFQTPSKVFLAMEYVNGGELFKRLQEDGRFSPKRAQLYAAEIALAIGHLHSKGYLYRDLKPENILIDSDGHVKIADFGLVKTQMFGDATTSTFCGTPEYIAPEMIQQLPYNKSVDWWSYGVLCYEMLTSIPPFYDENTNKMYKNILKGDIHYPSHLSQEAVDFLSKLFCRDPGSRLGSQNDVEDIKQHPFFKDLNWDDVYNKKYEPEWKPAFSNEMDTSNFDKVFTGEKPGNTFENPNLISQATQEQLQNFTSASKSIVPTNP